jgi:Mannosyltransferase (PIG-V)
VHAPATATTERPSATGGQVTGDAAAPPWRRRRRTRLGAAQVLRPVAVFTASRAVALLAHAVAARISPDLDLLDAVAIWDGPWYAMVATAGYPAMVPPETQATTAFFPLFPMAIDALTAVTPLGALEAAVALDLVFGAGFAVALWMLVRHLADDEVADRATVLVLFFPGAAVLSMGYAEPLMLALAAACLLALVTRRWVTAGALAALATATRPNAIALCAACAWAAAVAVRRRREWRALWAPLLSPLGMVAFFAFLWARTGEAGVWFRVQREGWDERFDLGLNTVRKLRESAVDPLFNPNTLAASVGVVLVVVMAVLLWRWRPPGALVVYTAVVVALAVGAQTLGARPRFVLTAFPLLVALAYHVRGLAFTVLAALFAGGLAAMAIVFSTTLLVTP